MPVNGNTHQSAYVTDLIREVVERAHAEGIEPREVSSALAYELAAEIAFGTVHHLDAFDERIALQVVDGFASNMRDQIRRFGPRRHQ